MLLLLLRHADAASQAPTDAERELTEKGRRQALAVAGFCQRNDIVPDIVLTSPYARARQTAEAIAQPPEPAEWLASGMRPAHALREMRAHQAVETVMLVGHQPDLGDLAAELLGLPSGESIHIRKASLTALSVAALEPRSATLEFFLPAALMGRPSQNP